MSATTFRPCHPPKSTRSPEPCTQSQKALELSKIDLCLKLKQWKQEEPNASHYFCLYIVVDAPQLPQTDKKENQASQKVSEGIQEVANTMNWQKPTLNAPRLSFESTKQIGKSPS